MQPHRRGVVMSRHTHKFRIEFAPGVFVATTAKATKNSLGDWHIVAEYRWGRGDPDEPFDPRGWPALETVAMTLHLAENRVRDELPPVIEQELDRWQEQLEADEGAPLAKDGDNGL